MTQQYELYSMCFVSSASTQRCGIYLARSLGLIFQASMRHHPLISGVCRQNQSQHESVRQKLSSCGFNLIRCSQEKCFKRLTSLSESKRYEKQTISSQCKHYIRCLPCIPLRMTSGIPGRAKKDALTPRSPIPSCASFPEHGTTRRGARSDKQRTIQRQVEDHITTSRGPYSDKQHTIQRQVADHIDIKT